MNLYFLTALVGMLPALFPLDAPTSQPTLTGYEKNHLAYPLANQVLYFTHLPFNPITAQETFLYKDVDLKQVAKQLPKGQALSLVALRYNESGEPVFQLASGEYLLASRQLVLQDKPWRFQAEEKTYWLKEGAIFYAAPYETGLTPLAVKEKAYQKVETKQKAETVHGSYFQLADGKWVSEDFLSATDDRMKRVQELLDKKYQKPNLAIYVKQMETGLEAGYQADETMYSASITKLPVLYYAQKQLDEGKKSLSQAFPYIAEVNDYDGAYDPAGSMVLPLEPDGKDYKVDDLIKAIAEQSDNVASNMLGYYVDDKFDKTYDKTIQQLAGAKWDMVNREVSPKMAGLIMEAMYHQGGFVMEALSNTAFDEQRIAKDLPVRVAHKIGDAYDFKHDVALVYSSSPFVLSIFTNESSYDEITAIANDIYAILN